MSQREQPLNNLSIPILDRIAQTIFDKKGTNILGLDVHKISSLNDYMIIAEGDVDRHVIAIAESVIETLKKEGLKPLHIEGLQTGDWVAIAFPGIEVHLFLPSMREKYHLEEIWRRGGIVDLNIKHSL